MMPMQPFQLDPSSLVQSTPRPRQELPKSLRVMLGLKTVGCLIMMGLSVIVLLAFSDPQSWPEGMTSEMAHKVANISVVATGVALLELLGVAGTWSFKRWGVYVLAGFSMMSFVLRVHMGDAFGAAISVTTTLITGLVVAGRWKEFE